MVYSSRTPSRRSAKRLGAHCGIVPRTGAMVACSRRRDAVLRIGLDRILVDWNRLSGNCHLAVVFSENHPLEPVRVVRLRVILPVMESAAFGSRQCRSMR